MLQCTNRCLIKFCAIINTHLLPSEGILNLMDQSQILCCCCLKSLPRIMDTSQLNHRKSVFKVSTYLWPRRRNIAALILISALPDAKFRCWLRILQGTCKVCCQICWNSIKSTYRSMLLGPVDLLMVLGYQILIHCSSHSQYLCYEISSAAVASWNEYSSAMLCETAAIWTVSTSPLCRI